MFLFSKKNLTAQCGRFPTVVTLSTALALAACGEQSGTPQTRPPGTTSLLNAISSLQNPANGPVSELSTPRFLTGREIVDEAVSPVITVDGQARTATDLGGGSWQVAFNIAAGQRRTVVITWNEQFRGVSLPLAQFNRVIDSTGADQNIVIDDGDYEFDLFDNDNDGVNNFDERQAGTDPFPANVENRPDADADGVFDDGDSPDNCRDVANPDQADADGDGQGDVCDDTPGTDQDSDGIPDEDDNCPATSNEDQEDLDGDGLGDACDAMPGADPDGDGVLSEDDNCPNDANEDQEDSDNDGIGDACEEEEPDGPVDFTGLWDARVPGSSDAIVGAFLFTRTAYTLYSNTDPNTNQLLSCYIVIGPNGLQESPQGTLNLSLLPATSVFIPFNNFVLEVNREGDVLNVVDNANGEEENWPRIGDDAGDLPLDLPACS